MSYHLNITIAGLCLLARDTKLNRLHVLIPPTGADVHHARLAYRTEYEVPGTDPTKMTDIDLSRKELDLTGLTSSTVLDLGMPADVFDFGGPPLGRREVPRSLLDGALPPPSTLRSRVRLAAGRRGLHRPGGFWFVKVNGVETSHRMATAIEWRLEDVQGNDLTLDLGGGERHTLSPLPDANGQLTIELMILHVMPAELAAILGAGKISGNVPRPTRIPAPRERAGHFVHYLPLLDPRVPAVVPEFDRQRFDNEGNLAALEPAAPSMAFLGSELTCALTTAPGKP